MTTLLSNVTYTKTFKGINLSHPPTHTQPRKKWLKPVSLGLPFLFKYHVLLNPTETHF